MDDHYLEVCDVVLDLRLHKAPFIQDYVLVMIPVLAWYQPPTFITNYFPFSMQFMIKSLNAIIRGSQKSSNSKYARSTTRGALFHAIGDVSAAVGDEIMPFFDDIMFLIKSGIKCVSDRPTTLNAEALNCFKLLTHAVGQQLYPHAGKIIDEVFRGGLSATYIEAMKDIVVHMPNLLETIQRKLIAAVSNILSCSSGSGGR